jgi:hypothetical protein
MVMVWIMKPAQYALLGATPALTIRVSRIREGAGSAEGCHTACQLCHRAVYMHIANTCSDFAFTIRTNLRAFSMSAVQAMLSDRCNT